MIRCKRVYDPVNPDDGTRFLVDRLWPRGIKKEKLELHGWLKEAAPSNELRKWFHQDPTRWDEFQRRYTDDLDHTPEAWKPLLEAALAGNITLLYSARDTEHNNAVVLKAYLEKRLKHPEVGANLVPAC
jgi:uncharacterized protein YeaO (DUF488 family)